MWLWIRDLTIATIYVEWCILAANRPFLEFTPLQFLLFLTGASLLVIIMIKADNDIKRCGL